jgi:hypothetical protein
LPLAGAAFVAMLQLTLVGEGWPLRRLRPLLGGLLAVTVSWAVALVVVLGLVEVDPLPGSDVVARHGPVPGADLGAALVLIGAWQVLCCVTWRGWPFTRIRNRAARLSTAHVINALTAARATVDRYVDQAIHDFAGALRARVSRRWLPCRDPLGRSTAHSRVSGDRGGLTPSGGHAEPRLSLEEAR